MTTDQQIILSIFTMLRMHEIIVLVGSRRKTVKYTRTLYRRYSDKKTLIVGRHNKENIYNADSTHTSRNASIANF